MQNTRKLTLSETGMDAWISLFGFNDENVALIESAFDVQIAVRDNCLIITGEEDEAVEAGKAIEKLLVLIEHGETVDKAQLRYMINAIHNGHGDQLDMMMEGLVAVTQRGKPIRCKTIGQMEYVKSIRNHDITFAIGPAGTGKTYLAIALAVSYLKNREIERIILTRPAVEAGEKLGFLPGDLSQKVDPYLRPLYDALFDFVGMDAYQKMVDRGTIEVAPLAYMRGRTLSNAFIILDEAQNCTSEQMKMFLTRLGFHSKMVVTGDPTQTDLPHGKKCGLSEAVEVLESIKEIGITRLSSRDVVRHELVQRIVDAYAKKAEETEE